MKHLTTDLTIEYKSLSLLSQYLDSSKFAIFDIETTGLSPANNSIILSGLIVVDQGIPTLHQIFAETPGEEEILIEETISLIQDCNYLITYNGRFFDLPFLSKRAGKYGITVPYVFNLDLFLLLKYYSELPKFLRSMSQKSVERYAGIDELRSDTISGGESVELYDLYLETQSKEIEDQILLHNSDDVKQLLRLTGLVKHVDIHRAFYRSGFPIDRGVVNKITIKKDALAIQGTFYDPIEYMAFPSIEVPTQIMVKSHDGSFDIILPVEKEANNIYVDLRFIEALGGDTSDLSSLPGFVKGYAILKEAGKSDYSMINLSSKLIVNFLNKYIR